MVYRLNLNSYDHANYLHLELCDDRNFCFYQFKMHLLMSLIYKALCTWLLKIVVWMDFFLWINMNWGMTFGNLQKIASYPIQYAHSDPVLVDEGYVAISEHCYYLSCHTLIWLDWSVIESISLDFHRSIMPIVMEINSEELYDLGNPKSSMTGQNYRKCYSPILNRYMTSHWVY